jgi:SAM-dependent methyltransferase
MSEREIRDVREFWEKHARRDPLWAILSDPAKRGRKWRLDEFFETGRREISVLLYHLDRLAIPYGRGAALDFGCGIGRLTQALAPHFSRTDGVDISDTMIRLANRLNRHPDRVRYHVNAGSDLRIFPDRAFDFIYSNIVLQHLPPELSLGYLAEFLRLLRPAGLLIFQLSSRLRDRESLPPKVEPLSDDAYASALRLEDAPPGPLPPSAEFVLKVYVRNASPRDWVRNEAAPIRVGNHWLSGDGSAMLIQDDGRTLLPRTLAAGEECLVFLAVRAPARPGGYLCEVDLVHESVSWFKDKGAAAVRFRVDARAGADDAAAGPGPIEPGRRAEDREPDAARTPDEVSADAWPEISAREPIAPSEESEDFPMYGIPRERVEEFLVAGGASIIRVEEDEHGGREWVGFRYFVRLS